MNRQPTLHHITPAPAGTACWCGADARVTRTAPGVESHYCAKHWALWWEVTLSDRSIGSIALDF
ncbi:MAG: hypothetical protein OWQ57_07395 [Sulfobacillus sp.]|nr:hypothetical protein [Sulfobacillus sp.]